MSASATPAVALAQGHHVHVHHVHVSRVIAACRRPDEASALAQLQQQHGSRLHLQQLDTLDDSSIQRAAAQLSSNLSHLDLLLNVSGILHNSSGLAPETSITRVQRDNLLLSLGTNAIGPILVCQALLPLISRAAQHGATEEQPAVIANFSARVRAAGKAGWLAACR
jgi:NAD(P)-dependent dehydrogenase (short-subunit alcohol dehydrogenase family)